MLPLYLLFYLLRECKLPPLRGRRAPTLWKETIRKDEGEELRKGKGSRHSWENAYPHPWLLMLIGDEEWKGKQEWKKRERTPNPATLDYLVSSYDPHWSYDRPILKLHVYRGNTTFIYVLKFRKRNILKVLRSFKAEMAVIAEEGGRLVTILEWSPAWF